MGIMVAGGTVAGRLANKVARGWRVPVVQRWKIVNLSEKEKFGNSYFKEMLMQTPGVAVFLACQVGVVAMIAYGIHLQSTPHCFTNKPFKRRYTVFRPDDPRIERLREMPRHYNQEGTIPNPAPAFNYSGYRYLSQKGDLV